MSLKNDYIQFRKKEEDYQKEKNSKITWQQIQNCDYDNFIMNKKSKKKNNHNYLYIHFRKEIQKKNL